MSLRITSTAAPVREEVARVLRSAIAAGQFAPGQRLIEREICEMTGVSRTSIREAMRQLESEGLITSLPNRGPIVSIVTPDQARDLYEVRGALEGLAGAILAVRGTDAQREKLADCMNDVRALSSDVNAEAFLVAKDRFYDALLDGAGNEVATSTLRSLYARITVLRRITLSRPGRVPQMLEELERIVAAIDQHDPVAAREACEQHVKMAASIALQSVEGGSEEPALHRD